MTIKIESVPHTYHVDPFSIEFVRSTADTPNFCEIGLKSGHIIQCYKSVDEVVGVWEEAKQDENKLSEM